MCVISLIVAICLWNGTSVVHFPIGLAVFGKSLSVAASFPLNNMAEERKRKPSSTVVSFKLKVVWLTSLDPESFPHRSFSSLDFLHHVSL